MRPDSAAHNEIESGSTSVEAFRTESSTNTARRLKGRIWYWWSLFVAAMLLLVFGPPVILVSYLARRREWVYPWALWGAKRWLQLSGAHVKVRGLERLRREQPYVFIANHRSFLDTAALFSFMGRRIGVIAKKELLKIPILGYGMGYVNVLAIDRSNRTRAIETMKAATDRLRRGISFGVFAEGTRALPGQLLPFKKGAFYMAVEAGVPVVPVAIKNTDLLMGKGTGVAQPGVVEMVVLEPVPTEGVQGDEAVARLADRLNILIGRELAVR